MGEKLGRIVHLTSAHPRDDIRIFVKECRSLARHGHEVFLVVADGLGDDFRDGVQIIDAGGYRHRLDRMLGAARRVYHKAMQLAPDVCHLHDPELLPVGLRLKRRGVKVVFDAHEDFPQQLLGKHYLHPIVRRVLSRVFARFERYACARFDGVVAATPFIREKFEKTQVATVDVNNFPMLGELQSERTWMQKASEVCYVGSIAEIRGIKEMVRAMELTRSAVRLNLVGRFAESAVEAEVKAYTGWRLVNALGTQDRAGVRSVLERSVAGVVTLHPTKNYLDSLPIKMFEYMSAGIPVIASNFPLWSDILRSADCGICVDPRDPGAIASAIDTIVADPARAEQMGQNGRQVVEERYNWANEEAKLLLFYAQLLPSGFSAIKR